MHIKKIEIAGFKSFVDRTVIHFDHDVIGVVGPNGCGKSNIVDAIRWCMGEQSAKHLRGRLMEDVIFNGSESRGPHGLAEVTLTFDNSDPAAAAGLPPEYRDYPELGVTRRLYRDGTSEYLINKTQVRLRDVTDLFLGTGVGTKAYSIVEQGRIGQIVSSRPEDRRLFIEEAAGITKYKQRKKHAERKMELTRQNLLRLSDIVSEIERSRSSLKRQVAKAERFLQYRSELEDLTLHEASHRLLELIVTERVERESLETSTTAAGVAREQLKHAEEELEAARRDAWAIESRTDDASRRAFDADNQVSSLQAEIERSDDRLQHLEQRLRNGETEREEILARVQGLCSEQDTLTARIEELGRDESAREADAAAEDDALEGLRQEEARANEVVQTVRNQAAETSRQAAGAEVRLDNFTQRIDEARARRDRLTAERETLHGELTNLSARKHALERSVAELAEGKRLTEAEREALAQEMDRLREQRLDSERAVDAAKNELGLKRNRLRALEELHRRLEGVGAGARALLSKSDPTVLGMVADRIEAPEELTVPFAALLGERLQYVVVSDGARGLELLEELRTAQRGRAHIVPAQPQVAARDFGEARQDPAVLGVLSERLSYAPADEALVHALIGDAVLVENAERAVQVAGRYAGVTAVALDGTVAHPGGAVSGGSGDDVAAAMLEQKREMHVLGDDVARLEARCAELVESHNALRARITDLETSLERAREGAHEGALAHITAEKDLSRAASEIERNEKRAHVIDGELGELERVLSTCSSDQAEQEAQLDTLRSELDRTQHELTRAETHAASWKERVAAQAALVTERKVRLAQVKEQMEAARAASERVAASLGELVVRAQRLEDELHESAQQFGETAGRIVVAREARVSADERARAVHAELDAARAELDQVRQLLGSREAELKQLRDGLAVLDESTQRHQMALQRIELEREHLLRNIRERFRGLELPRVVGDYHARPAPDAEHRRRIDELAQVIDRMGPVNLDAKAEYEEAERRFVELTKQKQDVELALEELERAIKHMNKESRKRFRETFDSVNELFKKTFTRMFRGGRAELVLTDPENLLDSGVDIIAQPPGKKLGNIELMSGGEKALTAVSLIFAIFQHKPSPFCVLDEVDAPLDEANVARYNDAIRSMTASSQFILITHVRKTMESVDVLYGVTMGEPGVSRIVSVKVNEKAVQRSEFHAHGTVRDTQAPPLDAEQQGDESQTQVA
ncbi:MAG TPA: chromosome segregation protein SMC [Polyangiaceae bacterium]